jgi:3-hydroxyisobutyrate dehydrogenase
MTKPAVAVVGLGAMGSRIAHNFVSDGYPTTVWNRSPEPGKALGDAGARVAATPREAAHDADLVLVCLADDDVSRAVWLDSDTGVLAGLRSGSIGVETSTLTPSWVRELASVTNAAGARFLEAPMLGTLPHIESRQLMHLVGGPDATLADAQEILSVSANALHHVGDYGSAAVLKLVNNTLAATQAAAVAELINVIESERLDTKTCLDILTKLPVMSPSAVRLLGLMTAREFTPNFTIRLLNKDLRYMVETAEAAGTAVPMSRATMSTYAQAEESGYGEDDISGIAQLYT